MKRREVLAASAALGIGLLAKPALAAPLVRSLPDRGKPVKPPAHGPLKIGFLVGTDTVLIDLAGPWEAFQDTALPIQTFTVAANRSAAKIGGIRARPEHAALVGLAVLD